MEMRSFFGFITKNSHDSMNFHGPHGKKTTNNRKNAEISSTSFPRSLFSASLVVEETREVEKSDPGNQV